MEYKEFWQRTIKEFNDFLRLEKSLSENSISAYNNDLKKLTDFLEVYKLELKPTELKLNNLEECLTWMNQLFVNERTQARFISGIKTFFKYLVFDEQINNNPANLLEAPRLSSKLPEVLSVEEIDLLVSAIDLSTNEGQRNKAIVETLYSCGLRVSELCDLNISNLYFEHNFITVIGKGNKERLVPISQTAIKNIKLYQNHHRHLLKIAKEDADVLFLNRRGKKLTRAMIFTIIKNLATAINLKKNISPHTFRHSFASHLIDGGADLRAVQEMLGHESITTTEIYTHLDSDYLRDTIISFHPRNRKKTNFLRND